MNNKWNSEKLSTTDAIYALRQICEKSIEFCKPVFLCLVDLCKALDRVKSENVLATMEEKTS